MSVFGICQDCAAASVVRDPNDLRATKLICRRRPPVGTMVAVPQPGNRIGMLPMTCWPIMEASDGCWEWMERAKGGGGSQPLEVLPG